MEEDVREGIIRVAVGAMNAHDEVRQRVRKRRTLLRRAIFAFVCIWFDGCLCYYPMGNGVFIMVDADESVPMTWS